MNYQNFFRWALPAFTALSFLGIGMVIGSQNNASTIDVVVHNKPIGKLPGGENLEKMVGEKVVSITPTQIPTMFEVQVANKITYVDQSGKYAITGRLINLETGKNYTEERLAEINRLPWSTLPHANGIVIKQGEPKLKFAVFTDPDCPYCRKLQAKMDTMNNVEITIFPMPLEEIHPEARMKSEQALCEDDKPGAWKIVANGGNIPYTGMCDSGINNILTFAKEHHINGTPFIVAYNGKTSSGLSNEAELEKWLHDNNN